MPEAIAIARRSIGAMVDLQLDAVSHCERAEDGTWKVVVDLVESVARMGENDLLAAYEVTIGVDGELKHFTRLRRYRREDMEAS